jgi:hypothetical protein
MTAFVNTQTPAVRLTKLQESPIISVFFPDVQGALTPTVTATFVDATAAIW